MAKIIRHMEPGIVKNWNEFCDSTPPFSIALDGFVTTGPKFNEKGPHVNFNHHEDVDRLATRSTCAQVLMAIRQGLFDRFNGEVVHIWENDCDEDVCLSDFILHNAHLAQNTMNPLLNRLVLMEDILDTTAGAYPFPTNLPILKEMAWIFEPYRSFRLQGGLDKKDARAFESIVVDAGNRIMNYILGKGEMIKLDTRYERIGGGKGWAMIKEIGAQARTGLFSDGIHAYVAVRERSDGKWAYVVGRMSIFVPFDVPKIISRANQMEFNISEDKMDLLWEHTKDPWGGGNTIGGSPRLEGSSIPPSELEKLINEITETD